MLLKILHYPDDRLRQVAQPVTIFDENLKNTISDMLETMYNANGIGLAAIQVGINQRIIVLDLSEDRSHPQIFINPQLSDISTELNIYEEGCLSVPNIHEKVTRPKSVNVTAQDMFGRFFTINADNLLSTCIQHEIDHLSGKVFIDRLSRLKKNIIDEKIKKAKKAKKAK